MSAYSTTAWRHTRTRYLHTHPTCTTPGCAAPSTVVDHTIPRRLLQEQGIHDVDDDQWLQALCKPCHDRKTATTDGGFGRTSLPIHQR